MANSYRTCSVAGCDRKHKGHGYCIVHYSRFVKHGDPLKVLSGGRKAGRPICSIDGCGKESVAKVLCDMHYRRFCRHGDPLKGAKVDYSGCSIPKCDKKHYCKGYCKLHYDRFKKHGDPLYFEDHKTSLQFIEEVVANPPQDCVIWPFGKRRGGYGRTWWNGKTAPAHRVALILHTGNEPEGMLALHGRCHNPSCINPLHLRWGTPADNTQDMAVDGTKLMGEGHPLSVFTEAQVLEIRSLIGKKSQRAIARKYGVSQGAIAAIAKRKTWAWLD